MLQGTFLTHIIVLQSCTLQGIGSTLSYGAFCASNSESFNLEFPKEYV